MINLVQHTYAFINNFCGAIFDGSITISGALFPWKDGLKFKRHISMLFSSCPKGLGGSFMHLKLRSSIYLNRFCFLMLQANTSGYPHTAIYVNFLHPTVPMTSRGILINMLLASACELDLFDRTGKEKCFYKDICIPFKNI